MKQSHAVPIGVCPTCGKLRFLSRKAARRYQKKAHPWESLTVYECEGYYHYGHAPYVVQRGIVARKNIKHIAS